ncbi:RICIN domain-containing protein [Ruminococcus sp.]|uniref:rhamnogalacturonan lyase family protein n=1 Tax=Ruminococcus sp. TaxID=41978 RepID=UPI0025DC9B92|nr:RICIN domain-containing protein [Ruminococcus sp.]MBQ6251008.1 RICIN domain-containing protein [Ruminococcus sp.]
MSIMKHSKRLTAAAAALTMAASSVGHLSAPVAADAAYGVGGNGKAIMEYLDRGVYAVKSGSGMFVSWRWNADDADDAEFRLYRDDKLIYTSKKGDATSYQDNGGGTGSKYRVDCVEGGKVTSSEKCRFTSGTNYFDIKLDRPGSQYSPNDCVVGDVDGDGQYEIFLKWDPSNSKDNSQEGKTDDVLIDCYTLEGKKLWRINLGKNIRAGQHYTQMCVADFDCDGKAELITKTADGTTDGRGKVIGDGSKDYRNGKGYILSGPEYMTLFDGKTGAALDTIDFPVPRGKVSDWGDNYGNRVDRMNSGIAYLDGVHPSAIYGRGYYTRLTWSAIDVRDKKLVKRWVFDTGNNKSAAGWGCGNHNVMAADCDNDGKQEIFTGASCIDDNGKLLWTSGDLHGDAMHVGDLIPDREGLEVWQCHEDKPYGETCYDAKTGKRVFHISFTKDTGRCAADNIWAGNKGAEFWGAADGNVYDSAGKKIGGTKPAQNFFIYWDGDLEREILDGNKISKMTGANKIDRIFTANGCGSNNSSKSVPCMTADLFGDWREELIMRTDDNSKLRIWCTADTTKVRLTTLMHDMQYRAQNCCQQSAYNQPPHVSCYLGSDAPLPARPKVLLNNTPDRTDIPVEPIVTETVTATQPVTTTQPVTAEPVVTGKPAAEIKDGEIYSFRNAGSGLYLGVEGGNAEKNANIAQSADRGQQSRFRAVSAGNGYFCLVSLLDEGTDYAMDVHAKKTEDGTNIELYTLNNGENQQFRFMANGDGSYKIAAKISGDRSCVTVSGSDGNVFEQTINGSGGQNWFAEPVAVQGGGIVYGDTNCDGTVDLADAILIMQALSNPDRFGVDGTEELHLTVQGRINADCSGGGDGMTSNDALAIQNYLLGKMTSLPER